MNHRRFLVTTGLFFSLCSVSVLGQDLPKASRPVVAGISSERLSRLTQVFQGQVDKGAIPGAVMLVARDNKTVYIQPVGYQDREKRIAMKPDAIFRIASMSKPITSVAAMMLAEEGKIDLFAPVAHYLPEFKNVKVGVEKMDPGTGKPALRLEDAQRAMMVQDLLRHTSGLVYGPFGTTLVHQEYNKANLFDSGQTLAEFVTKLTKLPLAHQPGTTWEYSMSTDVLSRIVEVVSGMAFDQFVEQRITKPLGMRDTGFYLSAAQAPRVAEPQVDPATGQRPERAEVENLTKEKVKWFSGGGGMLSTAGDYARFCQMLLNGGELNGMRLLSPKTVAIMSTDQLPAGMPRVGGYEDLAPTAEIGQSFGLGFAVRTHLGPNPADGSVGDYFWAGVYGTYFWLDPQEKLYGILMLQMPFPQSGYYRRAMRQIVYGALLR